MPEDNTLEKSKKGSGTPETILPDQGRPLVKSRPPRRVRNVREGNVVLGFTTDCHLALDCDWKSKEETVKFAEEYSKAQSLGSSLVVRTSYGNGQVDLLGNVINNYAVVFGKRLTWEEIKWHIDECFRLGMINRGFRKLRKFGFITIRVNAKNNKIPHPDVVRYVSNGGKKSDREGVKRFLEHWKRCKSLGMD